MYGDFDPWEETESWRDEPKTEPAPPQPQQYSHTGLYIMLILVLSFQAFIIVVDWTRNESMRRELDENAVLIKQLQETVVVKQLAKIKKDD